MEKVIPVDKFQKRNLIFYLNFIFNEETNQIDLQLTEKEDS